MSNQKSVKNITRIDHKYTHGWQVRMQYDKEEYSSFFADKKYGGQKRALLLAGIKVAKLLLWKKMQPNTMAGPYTKRFYYPDGIGENSSTPVVGVYRTKKEMRSGNVYPYYQTTVAVEKGKPVTRACSIRKHGEREAFLKMCEFRKEKMKEIYGERFEEEVFDRRVNRHLRSLDNG